jgi:Ser/Thr protein kinase RdoA (MazF antagonist)
MSRTALGADPALRERARSAAREYGYLSATIEPLPHPWALERVYRLRSPNRPDCVLKAWQGPAVRSRVRSEIRFTQHLEGEAFGHHAALLRTRSGTPVIEERDGLTWTAYEYLEGVSMVPGDPTCPVLMGYLLADLHQVPAPPEPGPSRLETFPELSGEVRELVPSRAVRQATSIVLDSLGDLIELPRRCIHGDFNPQNVIVRAGQPLLIDLEFSRWDLRLLDFASLVAPWRLASGPFRVDSSFAPGVARAYGLRGGRLEPRERELFPAAALAHTLFMIRDLSLAATGHAGYAHTLLEQQLSTVQVAI